MLKEVYPELDFVVWFGVFAPVGTPPEIVGAMNAALTKASEDELMTKTFFQLALSPVKSTTEEARKLLHADHERYGRLIRDFKIKVE